MSRKQFVKQLKNFKISEQQQKLLDKLVASGTFATEAEIFRQGIHLVFMHNAPSQEFLNIIKDYGATKE